jgi:predicted small secreted protein
MKTLSWALIFPLIATCFSLVSCATVSKVGKGSVALVKKTTTATTSRVSSLSEMAVNKINPPGVKVVEVREKDLKALPTGHDRAIAFENTRKKNFWFFNGPVDFIEPELPEPTVGAEEVDILLPPKVE